MSGAGEATPRWVEAVLAYPAVPVFARALLVSAYILGGFQKLADWPGAVTEQAHFGMAQPAFWAAVTIVVELVGSALVLANRRFAWLGAGMLGVFTVLAAFVANDFWTMAGAERFMARNAFFEHLGLAGAFVLAAILSRRHATA